MNIRWLFSTGSLLSIRYYASIYCRCRYVTPLRAAILTRHCFAYAILLYEEIIRLRHAAR